MELNLTYLMDNIQEQMGQRIASGEFGSPPDISQINAAWSEYMEEELAKRGAKPIYNTISGLWIETSGKVAYSGRVKEEITIPAGAKLLCFRNTSENEKAPTLSLVWVSYE